MSSNGIAIVGGTALLGRDLRAVEDATILIRGESISVAGEAAVPEVDEVVDARGGLVIPGFIDAHVHIGLSDPRAVLAGGVTTVRDLAWPPSEIHRLARRSRDPGFDGPLILAAGPMVTAPGGYPTRASWAPRGTGIEIADPRDAAAVVEAVAAAGAVVVKIALNPPAGPVLPPETVASIVAAAKAAGLGVTAHVHGIEQLEIALAAGVSELAHMLMSDEEIPDDLLDRMVAASMVVVPTLSIRSGGDADRAIENTRRFRTRGGTIVYGTDLGNEGPRPGIDRREVAALAAAGLSAREIVAVATVVAADHLGLPNKGALEPGADADVVVVGGAALSDPVALCDARAVVRAGRLIAPKEP